jgi:hypothetical protein
MSDEVSKIGNVSFIQSDDGTLLHKTVNADFQLLEDFFKTEATQIALGDPTIDDLIVTPSGTELTTKVIELEVDDIKVYLARYRKGECDWEPTIYFENYHGLATDLLDEWELLYSNDRYVAYKSIAKSLPTTLPLDGAYPSFEDASFVQYEKFTNVFSRIKCEYIYDTSTHDVEYVDEPGDDAWSISDDGNGSEDADRDMSSSSFSGKEYGSEESLYDQETCEVTYTRSTPVGCESAIPSLENFDLGNCDCLDESDIINFYSTSSSSHISEGDISSDSSSSNVVDIGEQPPIIEYDPDEDARRNIYASINEVHIKIDGYPFTGEAYTLYIQDPQSDSSSSKSSTNEDSSSTDSNSSEYTSSSSSSLSSSSSSSDSSSDSSSSRIDTDSSIVNIWESNQHHSNTKTTGSMTLSVNDSGVYFLEADIVIDGIKVIVKNAILTNMYFENIVANSGEYTKGVFPLPHSSVYIDGDSDNSLLGIDCCISHDKMYKASNNALKKVSEIVFEYERAEMVQDEEAPFINLYLADPNPNSYCRTVGSFCLENVDVGRWYYQTTEGEEVQLQMSQSGRWTLYRKYIVGEGEFAEFRANIDPKHIINNSEEGVPSFSCLGLLDTDNISTNDNSCFTELYIVFVSSDECEDVSFDSFDGDLNITLEDTADFWYYNTDYTLKKFFNGNGFVLWGGYTDRGGDEKEFALLMTYDGANWRLGIGGTNPTSYIVHEFESLNSSISSFETIMRTIPGYNIRVDKETSETNMSLVISGNQ